MDLSRDDIRLFISLWETRSLSLTARALNLTIPSASRRLARLRQIFDDACFVRSHAGLVPTEKAGELLADVRAAGEALDVVLNRRVFDPATARQVVRIAVLDNAMPLLLRKTVKIILESAPGITLAFSQAVESSFDDLQAGKIDFVINPRIELPQTLRFLPLHVFNQSLLLRKGHPLTVLFAERGSLEIDDLMPYGRILFNKGTQTEPHEEYATSHYDRHFQTRNVQKTRITVPYFIGGQYLLEESDLTMTLPSETAEIIAARNPYLTTLPAPAAKEESITTCLFWHERTHGSPLMQWIRAIFKTASQTPSGARAEMRFRENDEADKAVILEK